uniref:Uncharacterized protein n=1 Tax=Anopheles coluzzii TaxID=1518534 RepID=A0A8W7Q301_ANOCL
MKSSGWRKAFAVSLFACAPVLRLIFGLMVVMMIGLSVELKYPSQRQTLVISGLMLQLVQVGSRIAMMKNGSQQHTNAPVMMASVLAAFRSRFESVDDCVFLREASPDEPGGRVVDEQDAWLPDG